jgi:very-short-patch-repair endonuclease
MVSYFEQKQEWKRIGFFNKLRRRAKKHLKNPTEAEVLMWEALRKEVNPLLPEGCYFRRQFVQVPYILDFYCEKKRICIEVDGGIHQTQIEEDQKRDSYLKRNFGIETLRVANEEVFDFQKRKKFIDYVFFQLGAA